MRVRSVNGQSINSYLLGTNGEKVLRTAAMLMVVMMWLAFNKPNVNPLSSCIVPLREASATTEHTKCF